MIMYNGAIVGFGIISTSETKRGIIEKSIDINQNHPYWDLLIVYQEKLSLKMTNLGSLR